MLLLPAWSEAEAESEEDDGYEDRFHRDDLERATGAEEVYATPMAAASPPPRKSKWRFTARMLKKVQSRRRVREQLALEGGREAVGHVDRL